MESPTFVKAIHVQLTNERGYVCMLKVLSAKVSNHAMTTWEKGFKHTPRLLRIQKMGT